MTGPQQFMAWFSGLWILFLVLSLLVRGNKGPKGLEWSLRGMGWGCAVATLTMWAVAR